MFFSFLAVFPLPESYQNDSKFHFNTLVRSDTQKSSKNVENTTEFWSRCETVFVPPPAKADIATAILTNVIEHLVLLFCPPISTPSPPKRCGRIYFIPCYFPWSFPSIVESHDNLTHVMHSSLELCFKSMLYVRTCQNMDAQKRVLGQNSSHSLDMKSTDRNTKRSTGSISRLSFFSKGYHRRSLTM